MHREPASWDDVFFDMCSALARRSKDPSSQVGAVVVDSCHRVVSFGFNGPPAAIRDDAVDWSRPAKYPWIIHAEENALWFAGDRAAHATMYSIARPCSKCVLRIVRQRLQLVKFKRIAPAVMCDEADWDLARRIAAEGGLTLLEVP